MTRAEGFYRRLRLSSRVAIVLIEPLGQTLVERVLTPASHAILNILHHQAGTSPSRASVKPNPSNPGQSQLVVRFLILVPH